MKKGIDLLPRGSRVFPLKDGSKAPAGGRGHLDASVSNPGIADIGNYGIALDGQFLVVDIDDPKKVPAEFADRLPWSWGQRTKRGQHILYSVPSGFKGKNAKIPNDAGDLKVNGYIVGPGSVVEGHEYTVSNMAEPVPAPEWLLALCADTRGEGVSASVGTEQNLQIREGEGRNQFLTRVAGSLRGLGIGAEQVKKLVRSTDGTVCQPPLTEGEIRSTIDKSIEKWAQRDIELNGLLLPNNVVQASSISGISEPFDYMIRPLIPKIGLTLMHGKGSVGKSTFASFVTA